MRNDIIPPEFESLAATVLFVHAKSANEFSSSCPKCGGVPHPNGDFPDRFIMWRVSKYGKPLGWCRHCGFTWTPDKERKPTRDEIELWQREQIAIETARKDAAERALALLQSDKMWERFYASNNELSRKIFRERGIADSWIDYEKLGIISDYTVYCGGEESYHSPALTIPVWNVGGVVQNIKLRVANPRTGRDRYRNFYEMGQSFLGVPLYDVPLHGSGVIVEGEFKGIAMEQSLDDINYRVVYVQSKMPAPELFAQLKDLDPVYVWLDPDASDVVIGADGKPKETAVQYVTRLVGKERVRVVDCPVKCDDGILAGMNPMSFIRMARKA